METSTKYVVGRLKGRKKVGRVEFFPAWPKECVSLTDCCSGSNLC